MGHLKKSKRKPPKRAHPMKIRDLSKTPDKPIDLVTRVRAQYESLQRVHTTLLEARNVVNNMINARLGEVQQDISAARNKLVQMGQVP